MRLPEISPIPEDTQPVSMMDTDTRPLTIMRRRASPSPLLLFLLMAGGAALTALMGGLLFVLSQPAVSEPITVYLHSSGITYPVNTTAQTVGGLLAEQNIALAADSVVSPPAETRLIADMTITLSQERTVSVTIDGETSIFRTVFENPLDILESVRFFPDESDRIAVNGRSITADKLVDYSLPAHDIVVQNAQRITIFDEGSTATTDTTALTVGEALAEAGIVLYLGDLVSPPVETAVEADMQITVQRASPITVLVDGTTIQTRVRGKTVLDALRGAQVVLNGLDYAVPPENSALKPEMRVRVVRVTEQVETTQQPIAYETVYQADAALELDQQQIIQAGATGILQSNVRIRYEDGAEVSRTAEGDTITQAPVNQIIAYGTNVVLRTIETAEGTREYWRKLRVYATSYHPAALGGDDVTATGRKLQKGIVGIDPKLIPYGSTIYVEGYGSGIAADTGGPRSSRYWIDLGYSDADWVSWSRWVDVYLLTPVPENFPVVLPPR